MMSSNTRVLSDSAVFVTLLAIEVKLVLVLCLVLMYLRLVMCGAVFRHIECHHSAISLQPGCMSEMSDMHPGCSQSTHA